jgi:hypothetical protein
MATAHALRAAMAKHPHLLSVPIQDAASYDEGRLAGSYFLLLDHVENQSAGFLRTAVEQALQQAGGREPAALGQALYDLLVNKGKLRQTYPNFVRDVMAAAIPNPGVWLDATITEEDEATTVVTRPSQVIGDAGEQARKLTDPRERLAAHRFTVTVPPLTARFFCLRRGNLKDGRDIDLKLAEGSEPADSAWLLTLRSDHLLHAPPKRPERTGTTLAGFGRGYSALWVGCFNAEPQGDKRLEVAVTLRPGGQPAAPRSSAFGARPR